MRFIAKFISLRYFCSEQKQERIDNETIFNYKRLNFFQQ